MRPLTYAPPLRVWFPTGNTTPDGKRMFASRDWKPGEKPDYISRTSSSTTPKEESGDEHLPAE